MRIKLIVLLSLFSISALGLNTDELSELEALSEAEDKEYFEEIKNLEEKANAVREQNRTEAEY